MKPALKILRNWFQILYSRKLQRQKKFKLPVKYGGNCLKQDEVSWNFCKLFFVYKLDICSHNVNADFTFKNCLFGVVKLTKNIVLDKYSYSGYDFRFDSGSHFFDFSFWFW